MLSPPSSRPLVILPWLYLEDISFKNCFLKRFLFIRFTWISPWFNFDLIIRREFEIPVSISASSILNCNNDFSRFISTFGWKISEIPFELLDSLLELLCFSIIQLFNIQKLLLIIIQLALQLRVYPINLEVLPECSD
jgi:hypothetical protein